MGTSKAIAGGLGGAATLLVTYLLSQVPFVAQMPAEPLAALNLLIGAGIGYLLVYAAPANR